MTSHHSIDLSRSSHDVAWGLRLQGGTEFGTPLSVQRVFSGTPADGNIQRGDVVLKVNGNDVIGLSLAQAQELIKSAGNRLSLAVQRDGFTPHDPHFSPQAAPPFAPSAYHPPPEHKQAPAQPTQNFHAPSFPAHSSMAPQFSPPGANVLNVKFQPMSDVGHQPQQNFQHHYHHPEPAPNTNWQPSHQGGEMQEQTGDVDDDHLKPVKEIKSMFNHGGGSHEGTNIVRKGHPVRMNQPAKHPVPHASTKFQPPSPSVKPAAATRTASLKQPPVYQQRSSYNPLDFRGINNIPKSPIPPNRPPGLIQRGAIDTKPMGTSLDYQRTRQQQQQQQQQQHHHPPQLSSHHHQTHPTAPPHGNVDPLTDFYLHGLNAKSDLPDFSKPSTAAYTGRVLPPRSEVAIKTPTGAQKKKEFKADQSAVYRILQEEEEVSKQRGRGGQSQGRGGQPHGRGGAESDSKAYQMPATGQSRLAELLEKDQAELRPFQIEDSPQQQQQYYQQTHQYQPHQQQQYQQHQQYQSPPQHQTQKHLMTSTAQFTPSPSRDQPPRHEHNDYQSYSYQPQQQQSWQSGRQHLGHSGLPETDF